MFFMDLSTLFWNTSLEEMKNGFVYDTKDQSYTCIVCGKAFYYGVIYPIEEVLLQAKLAVKKHIEHEHGSMFDYLIGMNKKYTGLTEHQKELLQLFHRGLSDKEIIEKMDAGSTSTIRNYRFTFKEKEKQAKVFLAIMELLGTQTLSQTSLIPIHKGATMVDERYAVTEEEKEKILSTYFKEGEFGPITSFPSKEKRKIIILQQISKRFEMNKKYTEKEINEILKSVYSDFVTIRRYLIEYGFMERTDNGSEYWLKR